MIKKCKTTAKQKYDQLIMVAKLRKKMLHSLTKYEVHHIIPKVLGGSNDKSNLVELTASEHVQAHALLAQMYPTVHGLQRTVKSANYSNRHVNHEKGESNARLKKMLGII